MIFFRITEPMESVRENIGFTRGSSTQNQRVIITDLENLERSVKEEALKPPTIIIVGAVVELHKTLHWFNPLPGANPRPFGGTPHV